MECIHASLALASGVLAAPPKYLYKGLALTSIDVKNVINEENGELVTSEGEEKNPIVTFDARLQEGNVNDKDACFIKNIKDLGGNILQAEKLTVQQAKNIIIKASADGSGKPLFCIHGYNTSPRYWLESMKDSQKKDGDGFNEGKFMPVPVIWPTVGSDYEKDQAFAEGAGNGLKSLKNMIDAFPEKSLLAHSMGNRVLKFAADAKFKFDNIFMVAADVPYDIFDKSQTEGLKIVDMLVSKSVSGKNKGKVYILVNENDNALFISRIYNRKAKLGATGAHRRKNWFGRLVEDKSTTHPEALPYIENIRVGGILGLWRFAKHKYHFFPRIVDIYQSKHF